MQDKCVLLQNCGGDTADGGSVGCALRAIMLRLVRLHILQGREKCRDDVTRDDVLRTVTGRTR